MTLTSTLCSRPRAAGPYQKNDRIHSIWQGRSFQARGVVMGTLRYYNVHLEEDLSILWMTRVSVGLVTLLFFAEYFP